MGYNSGKRGLEFDMLSYIYKPRPPLDDFIDFFWLHEGERLPHQFERLMPTGIAEFIVSLCEENLPIYDRHDPTKFSTYRGPILYGSHSEPVIIDTACQNAILGIHFKPGGLFPFFNVPAAALHNAHLPLSDLWGSAAYDLQERLLAARAHEERFSTLEAFLLQQTACFTRHPAVAYALRQFRGAPQAGRISAVTNQLGLSPKRFIQLFRQEVGLTPKLYSRLQRFNHVLHQIEKSEDFDWADMALASGYFDQAHFSHDFREFSGMTPVDYLLQRNHHFGHVPL
jgi:AraC-like DNA-binding protein